MRFGVPDGMKLEHFTDGVFSFEQGRTYEQKEPMGMLKPVGLWVSVPGGDPDWPEWCRSESFAVESLAFRSTVTTGVTGDGQRILVVESPEDLWTVHSRYAVDDGREVFGPARDRRKYWPMDWRSMARDFAGMIVAPYLWSMRLDGPSWYYGFDAASGCIWNLDAVDTVVCEQVDDGASPRSGRELIWDEEEVG